MPFVLGVDMEIKVKFEDRSKQVLDELEKKMPEVLRSMGNELHKSIYNFMTEDKVVDTGRLRGSISYCTPYEDFSEPTIVNRADDFVKGIKEKDTVVYGSNVEYASYVETGTTKQRARHYLKTGTYRAVPVMKRVVEEVLKGDK